MKIWLICLIVFLSLAIIALAILLLINMGKVREWVAKNIHLFRVRKILSSNNSIIKSLEDLGDHMNEGYEVFKQSNANQAYRFVTKSSDLRADMHKTMDYVDEKAREANKRIQCDSFNLVVIPKNDIY